MNRSLAQCSSVDWLHWAVVLIPAEESELPPQSMRPSMMDTMQSRRTGLQAKMPMVKSGTSSTSWLMATHSPSALMEKW